MHPMSQWLAVRLVENLTEQIDISPPQCNDQFTSVCVDSIKRDAVIEKPLKQKDVTKLNWELSQSLDPKEEGEEDTKVEDEFEIRRKRFFGL
jgi:hypothetical protein